MSRGPGRWQRALLEALDTHPIALVGRVTYNHLGREPTRSELVATRRAARRLVEDGKARAIYLGQCRHCQEMSGTWQCPECRAGCTWVLALTRTEGIGAKIESLVTSHRRLPAWLSVGSATSGAEATLTAGSDDA